MATLLFAGIILRVGSRPAQLFFQAAPERMTAQNPPVTSNLTSIMQYYSIVIDFEQNTIFFHNITVVYQFICIPQSQTTYIKPFGLMEKI